MDFQVTLLLVYGETPEGDEIADSDINELLQDPLDPFPTGKLN